MCLQRYQTKLNPCLQTGKWTPDEDDFLKEVINNYRSGDAIPWSTVAYYVEGRSREQCARRWEQLHPKSFRKGKWTPEEDRNLLEATTLFGINKWWKIQQYVPSRTAAQCRERWKNTLDRSITFGSWKYEEDKKLWLVVQEMGAGHWQKVARDHLPGRTDNMCLQRYRRLLRWYEGRIKMTKAKRPVKRGRYNGSKWKKLASWEMQKSKAIEKEKRRVEMEAKNKEIVSALTCVGGIYENGNEKQQVSYARIVLTFIDVLNVYNVDL